MKKYNSETLLICLIAAISGVVIFLTSFAVYGYFYKEAIIIVFGIAGAAAVFLFALLLRNANIKNLKQFLPALLIILAISFFSWFYHHDIPRGRDDMSYISAAVKLSESYSFSFSDPVAQPYHGLRNLENGQITSQFLPGYSAYLAAFYAIGGLNAIFIGNSLLILLSLTCIYFAGRNLAGKQAGLIALALLGSFYTTFWFPRRINAENLFMAIFWLSLWIALVGFKRKNPLYFLIGTAVSSLGILIRPEGMPYFAVYLLISAYLVIKDRKNNSSLKQWLLLLALPVYVCFLFKDYIVKYDAIYLLDQADSIIRALSFFFETKTRIIAIALGIAVFSFLAYKLRKHFPSSKQKMLLFLILGIILTQEAAFFIAVRNNELTWLIYRTQYVFENFAFYLLFIPILVVLRALLLKKYNASELLILLLVSPVFLFILEPNIALDQPWFMRRFYPVLIPFLLILAAAGLARFNINKKKLFAVVLFVIMLNLLLTEPILAFRENNGMQGQMKQFAERFNKNDLILMEPGWDWQQWGYALYFIYGTDILPNLDVYPVRELKKELPSLVAGLPDWQNNKDDILTIYKFNKQKELDKLTAIIASHESVYVLSENKDNPYPLYQKENLLYVGDVEWHYPVLNSTGNITGIISSSNGVLDIERIREEQVNTPPRIKSVKEEALGLYKVKDLAQLRLENKILTAKETENYRLFVLSLLNSNSN